MMSKVSLQSTRFVVITSKNHKKDLAMARKLYVTHAEYIEGYKVKVDFNDGVEKIVDFSDFLIKHPHPQHNKYKDLKLFKQFKIEIGTIVWGKNWDLIFPVEQLHKGKITL